MGTKAFDVYGEIALKGDEKVKSSLKSVETAGKKTSGLLGKSFGAIGGILAGVGIGLFAKSAFDAAVVAQKSQAILRSAIEATGASWSRYNDSVNHAIASQMALSAFDDEDLQDSLRMLVQRTGDVTEAQDLLALSTELSRGGLGDLAATTSLVSKVSQGILTPLRRMGIVLKDGATAEEALAALRQRYAGSNAAYLKTAAGAQDLFNVSLENFKETVGESFLPAATEALKGAAELADGFGKLPKETRSAAIEIVGLTGAATFLGSKFGPIGAGIGTIWGATTSGMSVGIKNLAVDFQDLVTDGGDVRTMAYLASLQLDGAANTMDVAAKKAEGLDTAWVGLTDAQLAGTISANALTDATAALMDSVAGYTDQLIYATNSLTLEQTAEKRAVQDKIAVKNAQKVVNDLIKDGKRDTDEYKLAVLNLSEAQNKSLDSAGVADEASYIAAAAANRAGRAAELASADWNNLTNAMSKAGKSLRGTTPQGPGSYALGGRPSGPMSGYPVTLHGTEWVIPEKSDSNALSLWRQAGEAIGAFAGMSAPVSPASSTSSMATGGNVYILADSRFTDMNKLKGQVESWNRGGIGSGMLMARMNMGG